MITRTLVLAVSAALVLGIAGCDKKTPVSVDKKAGSSDTMKDMTDKAAGAMDQAKEKAVAAAQSLYDNAKKELDALSTKISGSTDAEKSAWQKTWDGLKSNLDDAGKKLSDLKSSSTWQTAQSEVSSALTKLGEDIKGLASKVK